MNIIVTCGPSYEPIDQVRRLTNFSTGLLGITLANHLAAAGHTVYCLKGEQATDPTPLHIHKTIRFTTNDDLAARLEALKEKNITAIFHAAALCDFKVKNPPTAAKIPSRDHDELTLTLVPTIKILPMLRPWFPTAKIIGWKYELDGAREQALEKAFHQIKESNTNACVLNGAAYGPGFALCLPNQTTKHIDNLAALSESLNDLLR